MNNHVSFLGNFLFCMLLMSNYTLSVLSNNLGGNTSVFYESNVSIEGNYSYRTFSIDVTQDVSFLKFGVLGYKKGGIEFVDYEILINGKKVGNIVPTIANWQEYDFRLNEKCFVKGKNEVTIKGEIPDIPQVKFLELCTDNSNTQMRNTGNRYYSYLNGIADNSVSYSNNLSISSLSDYPKDYICQLGVPCNYSFSTTYYLNVGDSISISASLNDYTKKMILHLFYEDDPDVYSTKESIYYGYGTIGMRASQSGKYRIYLESMANNNPGTCLLIVNGNYYEGVPYNSYRIICAQSTNEVYNSFAINPCNMNYSNPLLFVEDLTHTVMAFSDRYNANGAVGSFDWDYSPRIKKRYSRYAGYLTVSSDEPFYPYYTVDLYGRCKFLEDETIFNNCPNLYRDDALLAGPANHGYDCIAWAVGVWDSCMFFSGYDAYLNGYTSLEEYTDDFFAQFGYTRTNNSNESIIDVWSTAANEFDHPLDNDVSHASVRKYSDNDTIAHGYAWESKAGWFSERIFHPRYDLEGNHYGQVVAYYKPTEVYRSIYEKVVNGEMTIEEVYFTEEELRKINNIVLSLPMEERKAFDTNYSLWMTDIKKQHCCRPEQGKSLHSYNELLNQLKGNPNSVYLIFQKIACEDVFATPYLHDLDFPQKANGEQIIREHLNESRIMQKDVFRTPFSNMKLLVKCILDSSNKKRQLSRDVFSDVIKSNVYNYNVITNSTNVEINFMLNKPSVIDISIYTLDGDNISKFGGKQTFEVGEHKYSQSISSGTYIVCLTKDGGKNIKKLIIK